MSDTDLAASIGFDDFLKFDVRVGSVTETEVRTNIIVRRRLPVSEVGVK